MAKKQKKVNYITLAKETGYSLGTISRYFNDGSISAEKRKVLDKKVKQTGYVLNLAASKLRRKKTNLLVILKSCSSINSDNYVVEGILSQTKNKVIVKYIDNNNAGVREAVRWSIGQGAEQIIIFAPNFYNEQLDSELVTYSTQTQIILYNFSSKFFPSVSISFDETMKTLSKQFKNANLITSTMFETIHKPKLIETIKSEFNSYTQLNDKLENNHPRDINIFVGENIYNYVVDPNNMMQNKTKKALISYHKIKSNIVKPNYWIFIDYLYVGIVLVRNPKLNTKIKASLFNLDI